MTIINNTHKFIYVHIPKTAGTSVTTLLSSFTTLFDLEIGATEFGEKIQDAYFERFEIRKHSTLTEIHHLVGENIFNSFYKFSFVRNPFDRIFSAYNFLREWESPQKDFNNLMRGFKTFSQFIQSDFLAYSSVPDHMFLPQSHWLENEASEVDLNFVGRVEYLAHDIGYVLDTLKLNTKKNEIKLQYLNESIGESSKIKIDFKDIEKIINIYQIDFAKYKYDVDPKFSNYFEAR